MTLMLDEDDTLKPIVSVVPLQVVREAIPYVSRPGFDGATAFVADQRDALEVWAAAFSRHGRREQARQWQYRADRLDDALFWRFMVMVLTGDRPGEA